MRNRIRINQQPQPRLPQPRCPCTPLKIRNEKGSVPMLCLKTNKDSRLMYLRCLFPLSFHRGYKDKVTHVHTQTFTPVFCPSDAFYPPSITAACAGVMDAHVAALARVFFNRLCASILPLLPFLLTSFHVAVLFGRRCAFILE